MTDIAELRTRVGTLFEGAGLWWGLAISVALSATTLALAVVVVVSWPSTRFKQSDGPPTERHALVALFRTIAKNALGVLIVALGAVMALPGVPGQGMLMMIVGLTLLDFPGRRRLEARLLRKPRVLGAINRVRARFDRLPLELD